MFFKNLLSGKLAWKHIISLAVVFIFTGAPLVALATHTSGQGGVTYVFDDGWDDVLLDPVPHLESYGYKATFCIHTSEIDTLEHMTPDEIDRLDNTGHEICAHSINHPYLTQLNNTQIRTEVIGSKRRLEQIIGRTVVGFATPYGDQDTRVEEIIRTSGLIYNRGVDDSQLNSPTTRPHRLFSKGVESSTTVGEVTALMQQAQRERKVLILHFHRFNKPSQYSWRTWQFRAVVNYGRSINLRVMTMKQVRRTFLLHS